MDIGGLASLAKTFLKVEKLFSCKKFRCDTKMWLPTHQCRNNQLHVDLVMLTVI